MARRAETTSTGVATTLALAELVVAKHLDEGIQRSIGIGLALSVEGNETADTPEADELWLRLEVSVEEVDGVGDGAVGDVRGRAVRRPGELRVAHDVDVVTSGRQEASSYKALSHSPPRRRTTRLPISHLNDSTRYSNVTGTNANTASQHHLSANLTRGSTNRQRPSYKSRFTALNTSQSVTRHEAIKSLLIRPSTDIQGEQTNGPRSGSASPAGTCRSKVVVVCANDCSF